MEWIQTLLISGMFILSCANHRQPFFVEVPKTWVDAQSYCRERCYDLATIDNMGAMLSLRQLIAVEDDELWIGLYYKLPEEWHWSLEEEGFYQEGERNYSNFQSMGSSRFVYQSNGGKWTIYGSNRYFVCYDGNKLGDDRYVLIKLSFRWSDAQSYCRSYHTDLVSIRSAEENQAVARAVGGSAAFIGLFKDGWHWTDRRKSGFRHWTVAGFIPEFPESCAVMTREISGRWKQQPCGELRPFVCGPVDAKKMTFKLKIRSKDIQDPNDPAVTASILKQLLNKVTLGTCDAITWTTNSDGHVFTKEECDEEDCNV